MIYETIYRKLYRLIPNLDEYEIGDAAKFRASGFMDLNLDILSKDKETARIALSHYYKHPSGDMIADPDMEIRVIHAMEMAEALTYQDSFGYREVYPTPDTIDVRAKKELNTFLNRWLPNLLQQGHKLSDDE